MVQAVEKSQQLEGFESPQAGRLSARERAAQIVARAGALPPAPFDAITEAAIEQLVRRFYGRVLTDQTLGPVFAAAIPGDWEPHLTKMFAFWSSVMLTSGRYKGNPFLAHARHDSIEEAHFAVWLALWSETAASLFVPELAAEFRAKAQNIARALTAGLFALTKSTPASTSASTAAEA
jgi:hemoglobin|tara:strand:- start:457 stop:990 length:534 start_codon:yes stop_codon:yes gene_type:complete